MNRRIWISSAGLIALGAGAYFADKTLAKKHQTIELEQEMPAKAQEVIKLIKQVEREPDFIPIIGSVTVHERSDSDVIYTVRAMPPLPFEVRFHKSWNLAAPRVFWDSQKGTLGFHNNGEIRFSDHENGCTAYLSSELWFDAPLISKASGVVSEQVIRTEFESWLRNLADELANRRDDIETKSRTDTGTYMQPGSAGLGV